MDLAISIIKISLFEATHSLYLPAVFLPGGHFQFCWK